MATKIQRWGEVVAVEKREGVLDDQLLVTVKSVWDVTVTFKVPLYRRRSYPLGRKVRVTLEAVRG